MKVASNDTVNYRLLVITNEVASYADDLCQWMCERPHDSTQQQHVPQKGSMERSVVFRGRRFTSLDKKDDFLKKINSRSITGGHVELVNDVPVLRCSMSSSMFSVLGSNVLSCFSTRPNARHLCLIVFSAWVRLSSHPTVVFQPVVSFCAHVISVVLAFTSLDPRTGSQPTLSSF